jgi:hypothetical protein
MGKASRAKKIMWVRSQRARKSMCPGCQAELTGVTGASPDEKHLNPYAGAPTICCYCGALLVFDAQLIARRPTPELAARLLDQYPLTRKLQADILAGMFSVSVPKNPR